MIKKNLILISVLIFTVGGVYFWANFNQKSYDTYYLWNSFYFIVTSLLLALIPGIFYLILRIIDKWNWRINNLLFYFSVGLTLVGYLTITVVKFLLDNAVADSFTVDITTVILIDPNLFKVLNVCFVGILVLPLPMLANLVIGLIRKKGMERA